MVRFQQSLIGDEEQEEDFPGDFSGSCSLSPLQRLYGFAACLAAGLEFMLLSLFVFNRPIKFAVMFSFGNLLAIGSWPTLSSGQEIMCYGHRLASIVLFQQLQRQTVYAPSGCENFNTRDFAGLYNLGSPAAAVDYNCQRESGSGGRRMYL